MSSAINKVKDALHLNKDHSTSTTHTTTGTTGTTHNSSVPEGTAGPHNSRIANAADPRVDSDLDSTRTGAVGTGAHSGTGALGSGVTDHTGTTHTATGVHNTHGTGVGHSTTGPVHNSNLANKLDPRVDSAHTTTGTGLGSSTHNTTGTHNTLGSTGTHGGISNSTNAGPHNSNLANKADPRVDSDLDGKGAGVGHQYGGLTGASGSHATPGSGTAQNTAGPHNSDMLNKLDPRVDADLDGSKTLGGNKTHT